MPMKHGTIRVPLKDRLLKKIRVDDSTSCWNWVGAGSKSNAFSGTILVNKVARSARLVAYEVFSGDVPEGFVLESICKNRKCINPAHMVITKQSLKMSTASLRDRFVAKCGATSDSGCIEWVGSKSPKGYGYIKLKLEKRTVRAHRVSYELHVGEIPIGMHVLHKCDNPSCVNPDHLFLGTNADNVADKVQKKRVLVGEQLKTSKLNQGEVISIKREILAGETFREIARRHGVHHATINSIKQGRLWKHVMLDDAPAPVVPVVAVAGGQFDLFAEVA